MKILNVAYSLEKGGTQRAAQNFAFGYYDTGHDSRVLYTRVDGIRRTYIENKGVPVYDLSDEADCACISEWLPDVVHLHSHGISIEEFDKVKSLVPHARYIETNVFSQPSLWVKQIDQSLQLSSWCDWLYQKRSQKSSPSTVVPYPVDISAFSFAGLSRIADFRAAYGIKPDDIVIGRIGQNYNKKWSPVLVDVFDSLRKTRKNLKLVIVNPPDSMLERVEQSEFHKDIIHIPQITGDADLADCYSSIDVFVLVAEQGESFGMVLAEALLCETPVVTLATPWGDNSQGEVVGNGIGGFVAANRKVLVRLVDHLIQNELLRQKMGSAGRNRIIELFDSRKVAADALNALNTGIKGVSHPAPADLMKATEGKVGLGTKIILASGCGFAFLRFTTGYQSALQLPLWFAKALAQRLLRLGRELEKKR